MPLKSSGKLSPKGLTLIREKIPYTGKGPDALLMFVRKILDDNPRTQKIVLEVGVPYVDIVKYVPETEASASVPVSHYDSVRNKPMEEFTPASKQNPFTQLSDMFSAVHAEGLEVGFILVSDKRALQDWLGLRIPITKLALFGVPVVASAEIPPAVLLVCGTPTRDGEAEDVVFSVKVVMV